MRGEGTRLSDIDFVVVYDHLKAARREAFVVKGVPIEAFVHDPETLAWFVNEDVTRGRPSILNMIVEGFIVGRDIERAEVLRARVAERLNNGPAPLSSPELNALRYDITDAVDDLKGERSLPEMIAIGALLHPKLFELALRGRRRWNGAGKWAPRLLSAMDPELAQRFDVAFQGLFRDGDARPLIALAESELAPHGGPLFDGDSRTAPEAWRIA